MGVPYDYEKVCKMKTFLLFTIIYSKINLNVMKTIINYLGNKLPTHVRENTSLSRKKSRQLLSAEGNIESF